MKLIFHSDFFIFLKSILSDATNQQSNDERSNNFFDISNIHERLVLKMIFVFWKIYSGFHQWSSWKRKINNCQHYSRSSLAHSTKLSIFLPDSLVLSSKAIFTTSISKSVSGLCSTKAMVFYLDSTPILPLGKTRYHWNKKNWTFFWNTLLRCCIYVKILFVTKMTGCQARILSEL